MSEPIATFHERLPDLSAQLAERGSLGLVVIDASALAAIEYEYGAEAYEEVRQRVFKLLGEQRGKDYRADDLLTLDEPRGLRFMLFLEPKRRRGLPFTSTDLRAVRTRLLGSLVPSLARVRLPVPPDAPRASRWGNRPGPPQPPRPPRADPEAGPARTPSRWPSHERRRPSASRCGSASRTSSSAAGS